MARRVPGVNDALADDVAETDIAVDAREPTLPLVMEVAALTHAPHCPTIGVNTSANLAFNDVEILAHGSSFPSPGTTNIANHISRSV